MTDVCCLMTDVCPYQPITNHQSPIDNHQSTITNKKYLTSAFPTQTRSSPRIVTSHWLALHCKSLWQMLPGWCWLAPPTYRWF